MSITLWHALEDALFRWLARRRLHRGPGTAIPPETSSANLAPERPPAVEQRKILRMPRRSNQIVAASLRVMPCAACEADVAWVTAQRLLSDPAHCEVCHLNWPTRIEIGNEALKTSEAETNRA